MMIGKPTDVGAAPPAPRTGAATGSRIAVAAPVASGEDKVDGPVASDSVKLSDTSRAMIAANQASDEFRADKVAAVRKAIEEGHYQVQARQIADRLIREASELLESLAASK